MNAPLSEDPMGHYGEGWVILQILALAVIFFYPAPDWGLSRPIQVAVYALGGGLASAATALMIWGFRTLGKNLRAPPDPKRENTLVQTGPFAHVRHPVYFSLLLLGLAWVIARLDPFGLLWLGLLFLVLYGKSRREEKRLEEIHPEYASYRARVPRFLPRLSLLSRGSIREHQ